MPPQISFSREQILDEAFEIVRQDGFGSFSARRIAQNLKCSTHPIYRAFQSMKELETLVIEKVKKYAIEYMLQEEDPEPFLAIGLRYFRFAQEEKELFKLLYMSGEMIFDPGNVEESLFRPLLERMKEDAHLQEFNEEQLQKILINMQIFTHGLATLASTKGFSCSEDFVREHLFQMGEAVIGWEHVKKNVIMQQTDRDVQDLKSLKPEAFSKILRFLS